MANVVEITIKGIDSFTSPLKKVATTLTNVGKKVSIATGATVGFLKATTDAEDKAAKFASRIGVAVEQLTAYHHAANLSGMSNEQFNLSTQRMTRRVAEAAQGIGEAKGALRELGINAQQFKRLSLDDQMKTLADKFNGVSDSSDRLRLAFKLFDSEGTAMLQMLGQGSEAMQAMTKDAERLGLVVGKQAAANSEAFNDSLTRAWGSIKGFSRTIAHEMIPIMTGLANRFADGLSSIRENTALFVKNTITFFFTFWEVVKQVFTNVKKLFTDAEFLDNFVKNVGIYLQAAGKAFWAFGKGIFFSIWEGIKAAGNAIKEFASWSVDKIKSIFGGPEVESFGEMFISKITPGFVAAGGVIREEIGGAIESVKEQMSVMGDAVVDGLGINLDMAKQKAQESIAAISEFGKVTAEKQQETASHTRTIMEELSLKGSEFLDNMSRNAETFASSFYNLMNSVIDSISQGIADAIVEGTSMSEVFSQIGKMILKELIAMFIKLGIQRLVLAAFNRTALATEASAEMAKNTAATYAASFASTAAIPIVGPALAPGVAAASTSMMLAGATAAAATGGAMGAVIGQAHDGMTNVPREGTFLLDKGERVLSPSQNSDLTSFLQGGGGGPSVGTIVIEKIEVLPNATSAQALLDMDDSVLREIVASKIYKAMDDLFDHGVAPKAIEKGRYY